MQFPATATRATTFGGKLSRGIAWRFEALRHRLYEVTPYFTSVVREISAVSGRSMFDVGWDVASAWARFGCDPETFASMLLWTEPKSRWGDFYLGNEFTEFLATSLSRADREFSRDKAAFAQHDRRRGVAWLPTLAVANRQDGVSIDDAEIIGNPDEFWPAITGLCRDCALVLKPACGRRGEGFFHVAVGGAVRDGTGRRVSPESLTRAVFSYHHRHGRFGYVVQPALGSSPEMVAMTGIEGLTSVRVVTAVHGDCVEVVESFLKVPGPGSLVDNFRDGSTGTLVAGVDAATGVLTNYVGLSRPGFRFALEYIREHPATGRSLAGKVLPSASAIFELARKAGLAHPLTATMGWDVAISSDGLFILDGNPNWGPPWQPGRAEGARPVLSRVFPESFR